MEDFSKKIDYYMGQYNVEAILFEKGREMHSRGYLLKHEFLAICLWKSRRPKQRYGSNSEDLIKSATKKALATNDETEKMKLLIELEGVQIPTASAILAVVEPAKYPIIDIRCLQALNNLGLLKWGNVKPIMMKDWLQYLKLIREMADKAGVSPRDLDKALFAFNRIELDSTYRNLYN